MSRPATCGALNDYGSAIEQNPKDADPYFRRGLIYLDMRRFDEAISDFTRSHDLDPKNVWPLANRGLAYAWKKDTVHAKQDFAAVRAIDPENKVLLHGEGLMFMFGGDLDAAVDRFTKALTRDPSDVWSLQMRADAYQQMGDFTQVRADRAKLLQLLKDEQTAHPKRLLFTIDDYPPEALRNKWHGTVVADLTVNTEGHVTACSIVRSSGHPILDQRTCEVLTTRATFRPWTDAKGKPVEKHIRTPKIVWNLP